VCACVRASCGPPRCLNTAPSTRTVRSPFPHAPRPSPSPSPALNPLTHTHTGLAQALGHAVHPGARRRWRGARVGHGGWAGGGGKGAECGTGGHRREAGCATTLQPCHRAHPRGPTASWALGTRVCTRARLAAHRGASTPHQAHALSALLSTHPAPLALALTRPHPPHTHAHRPSSSSRARSTPRCAPAVEGGARGARWMGGGWWQRRGVWDGGA
jgi:hypothetical protein